MADDTEQISDERLEMLKRRSMRCVTHHDACDCKTYAHLVVLREMERLQGENAALRQALDAIHEYVGAHEFDTFDTMAGRRIWDYIAERTRVLVGIHVGIHAVESEAR